MKWILQLLPRSTMELACYEESNIACQMQFNVTIGGQAIFTCLESVCYNVQTTMDYVNVLWKCNMMYIHCGIQAIKARVKLYSVVSQTNRIRKHRYTTTGCHVIFYAAELNAVGSTLCTLCVCWIIKVSLKASKLFVILY